MSASIFYKRRIAVIFLPNLTFLFGPALLAVTVCGQTTLAPHKSRFWPPCSHHCMLPALHSPSDQKSSSHQSFLAKNELFSLFFIYFIIFFFFCTNRKLTFISLFLLGFFCLFLSLPYFSHSFQHVHTASMVKTANSVVDVMATLVTLRPESASASQDAWANDVGGVSVSVESLSSVVCVIDTYYSYMYLYTRISVQVGAIRQQFAHDT